MRRKWAARYEQGMKALLFDMDGTAVDTEPQHLKALRSLLRDYGADPDIAHFHEKVAGRTSYSVAQSFFPDATPEDWRAFSVAKERRFRDIADGLTPAPGLVRLLDAAARSGLRTALVTNSPVENVDFVLGRTGLEGRFDTVVLAGDLPRPKPDPLAYLTALERLDIAAEDALAFEDSLPGITSATGAGVRVVGLTTSLSGAALLQAGACRIMADFTGFSLANAA